MMYPYFWSYPETCDLKFYISKEKKISKTNTLHIMNKFDFSTIGEIENGL